MKAEAADSRLGLSLGQFAAPPPLKYLVLKKILASDDLETVEAAEEKSSAALEVFTTLIEGSLDQLEESFNDGLAKARGAELQKFGQPYVSVLKNCQGIPAIAKRVDEILSAVQAATVRMPSAH